MAISIGKYFDGENAKRDFESLKGRDKMQRELEKGDILYTGETRVDMAKQGLSPKRPKAIDLFKKEREKAGMTKFEIENKLYIVDQSKDIIE